MSVPTQGNTRDSCRRCLLLGLGRHIPSEVYYHTAGQLLSLPLWLWQEGRSPRPSHLQRRSYAFGVSIRLCLWVFSYASSTRLAYQVSLHLCYSYLASSWYSFGWRASTFSYWWVYSSMKDAFLCAVTRASYLSNGGQLLFLINNLLIKLFMKLIQQYLE